MTLPTMPMIMPTLIPNPIPIEGKRTPRVDRFRTRTCSRSRWRSLMSARSADLVDVVPQRRGGEVGVIRSDGGNLQQQIAAIGRICVPTSACARPRRQADASLISLLFLAPWPDGSVPPRGGQGRLFRRTAVTQALGPGELCE